jgi:Holliday junction resolvase RusA-like endonuclease
VGLAGLEGAFGNPGGNGMKITRVNTDLFRTHKDVWVPLPPSTNHLFRTAMKKGVPIRVKAGKYKDWLAKAVPIFQTMRKLTPPLRAMIVYHGPLNEARDGDNMVKPILDAAKLGAAIQDDSLRFVRECRWSYCDDPDENEKGMAWVWFEEMGEAA